MVFPPFRGILHCVQDDTLNGGIYMISITCFNQRFPAWHGIPLQHAAVGCIQAADTPPGLGSPTGILSLNGAIATAAPQASCRPDPNNTRMPPQTIISHAQLSSNFYF